MLLQSAQQAPAPACLRGLPPSPAGRAIPVALDAGCGLVVFGPGGRAQLSARPAVTIPPGAEAAPGQGVVFRAGRVVWTHGGRVIWRSRRTFHAGNYQGTFTVISAASSSGERLAYVVSRWSGKPRKEQRLFFVTTPSASERLVSRKAFPLGWTPRGVVSSEMAGRRLVLHVWRPDGSLAAPARVLSTTTWAWDWSANQLYAVSRGLVVRTDGHSVRPLTSLRALRFGGRSAISLWLQGNRMLELATASRLAVIDAGGHTRFDASLPAGWRLAGTATSETDGTVAYEATPITSQAATRFRLYGALSGSPARLLDSYRVAPSCAPHGLALRGSDLLLTGPPGLTRLYDLRSSRAPLDLAPAIRWLRIRHRSGQPRLLSPGGNAGSAR